MKPLKIINQVSKTHSNCSCYECGEEYVTRHWDCNRSRIDHLCGKCNNPVGQTIDQALVNKFFNYDPVSGELSWRLPTRRTHVGDVVRSLNNKGYLVVGLAGKIILVHRVIWLMQTGVFPDQVDHIDHNRTNNSWVNLREVNNSDNQKNRSKSSNNTTGVTGVSVVKSTGMLKASIRVNNRTIHIGTYKSLTEAKAARKAAEVRYGFHTNHGSD